MNSPIRTLTSLTAFRCPQILVRVCFLILALCIPACAPAVAAGVYGFDGQFVDGHVNATAYFNGDLIAGGSFHTAGGAAGSNCLAQWNGFTWVGMNMPGADDAGNGAVEALTVHQGELFVAGQMQIADGAPSEHIIRWDGTNWKAVGNGLGEGEGFDGRASALLSFGDLYSGGYFTTAEGEVVNHVAKWDGSSWSGLGSGLNGPVVALVEYGGEVVAGGYFTLGGGVAAWNGSNWHTLGQNLGAVHDLVVFNGVLIAVGQFTLAGGSNVAWLDGSTWKPLGGGTDRWAETATVAGGRVYVAGTFNNVGSGILSPRISAWDGAAWNPLTTGVADFQGGFGEIFDLSSNGNEVIVAGHFDFAGGLDAPNLATWDGSSWVNALSNRGGGLNGTPNALLSTGGSLIVGGRYTTAAGRIANEIARWDGNWHTYGSGFDEGWWTEDVNALVEWNGSLIAGGSFIVPDTQLMSSNIAMWDGTAWLPLGSGLDGTVYALIVHNGELIAAGNFITAGGQPASRIARWDGTAWYPMGAGFNNTVRALSIYNGDLIAAGQFAAVVRWTNGTWAAIGSLGFAIPGKHPSVQSMTNLGGNLIISGNFDRIGGVSITNLARWNGTSWTSIPRPMIGPAYIADYFGTLVGSGTLSSGEMGVLALDQANSWYLLAETNSLEYPGDPGVRQLVAHDGSNVKGLVVGGAFAAVGGVPSSRIAIINPQWKSTAILEEPVHSQLRASPNPFQRSVTIEFTLEKQTRVEVTVLDVQGRIVSKMLDEILPPGGHKTTWNARNSQGQRAPAGMYFLRVSQGNRVDARKIVLIE